MYDFESFTEELAPRAVPAPMLCTQAAFQPAVPDVSLLDSPRRTVPQLTSAASRIPYTSNTQNATSTGMWNDQQYVDRPFIDNRVQYSSTIRKVNSDNNISNLGKKQVRFESPLPPNVKGSTEASNFNYAAVCHALNRCSSNIINSVPGLADPKYTSSAQHTQGVRHQNIPAFTSPRASKDLDLSLLETCTPPRFPASQRIPKAVVTPSSSYQTFRALYDDAVPTKSAASSTYYTPIKNSRARQSERAANNICCAEMCAHSANQTSIGDNSIPDLYRIIKGQNEQLLALQNQVARLLLSQEKHPIPEPSMKVTMSTTAVQVDATALQQSEVDSNVSKPKNNHAKGIESKSIGVMTSFAFPTVETPSHTASVGVMTDEPIKTITGLSNKSPEICNNSMTEGKQTSEQTKEIPALGIAESRSRCDDTLTFNDIQMLTIESDSPTPASSMHLQIQDYSNVESEDECPSANVGWTFYNNVLGQVNDILQNSPSSSRDDEPVQNRRQSRNGTLEEDIRQATVAQLKNLGVSITDIQWANENNYRAPNVPPINIGRTLTNNIQSRPLTEQSLAMNAMALKYLRSDQLEQLVAQNPTFLNKQNNTRTQERLTDMSMATVKYLEKYKILN